MGEKDALPIGILFIREREPRPMKTLVKTDKPEGSALQVRSVLSVPFASFRSHPSSRAPYSSRARPLRIVGELMPKETTGTRLAHKYRMNC